MTYKDFKRFIAGVFALIAMFGMVACGTDAKVVTRDKSPAVKINMPDQFDTLAAKCILPGVLVVESGGSGNDTVSAVPYAACKGAGLPENP